MKEQKVFEHAKRAEMKQILGDLVDGQIEMYQRVGAIYTEDPAYLIFVHERL